MLRTTSSSARCNSSARAGRKTRGNLRDLHDRACYHRADDRCEANSLAHEARESGLLELEDACVPLPPRVVNQGDVEASRPCASGQRGASQQKGPADVAVGSNSDVRRCWINVRLTSPKRTSNEAVRMSA